MFISKGKKKGRYIFPAYNEEALMLQPSEPRLPTHNGRTRGTSQHVRDVLRSFLQVLQPTTGCFLPLDKPVTRLCDAHLRKEFACDG